METLMGLRWTNVPDIPVRNWTSKDEELSNHQIWREISNILVLVYRYYSQVNSQTKPWISDLIFREKASFFGNTWSYFVDIWRPFINLLDDENEKHLAYDALMYGVDTWSGSQKIPDNFPVNFRSNRRKLTTRPVYDNEVWRRFRGRNPKDRQSRVIKRKFVRRNNVQVRTHFVSKNLNKPAGHRPLPLEQIKTGKTEVGRFKTSTKSLMCQTTIAEQIKKWMKMRAVSQVCHKNQLDENTHKVNTLLPIVVEPRKPRSF